MTQSTDILSEVRTVGVIGWGRMGAEMGKWLLKAGWPVVATDPSPEARDRIRATGATPVDSVGEVGASADLVLLVVVDDQQVKDIVAGDGGLTSVASPGTIVAVCSSVRPDTCIQLAEVALKERIRVVDVALVGGERAAEQGGLTLMCGGDSGSIEECMPAFSAFATDVCHVGGPGAGQVAKSANNILMWSNLRADVEVLRLAKSLGIQPSKLRSILNAGTGGNRVLADWGLHRMRWPAKDLEIAIALADEAGVDVPFVRALQPLMAELTREDLDDLR